MFTKLNPASRKSQQEGFTLVEVVLSMGIIAITLTLFALMLTSSANLQSDLDEQRTAERILYGEAEEIAAMRWDNIMRNPIPAAYGTCQLDGDTYSTQAVNPGPETITIDNLEVSITRNITWYLSDTPVECTDANKFRAEPKQIVITASWNGRSGPQTKSLTIIRSRWAEAPLSGESRSRNGELATSIYTEDFSNSGIWCSSYTNSEGVLINPGTADLVGGGLRISLGADQEGVCGINLQGLEIGKIYTAVITVSVPADGTAVSIAVEGEGKGPIANAGGGDVVLTTSWVEKSTSQRIGITVPDIYTSENGDTALITDFRVYANN
jgi:prepilin-type N-terminal cleavage/methylation domain-containing protein